MAVDLNALDDRCTVRNMNGNSFIIDTLVYGIYSASTLIDNGCECLAAVSNTLVRKANLPRMQVSPRQLNEATTEIEEKELITEMTRLKIDIDGYQTILYACIIHQLSHNLILDKPWMEQENVVYHTKEHLMEINKASVDGKPLRVWEKGVLMEKNSP